MHSVTNKVRLDKLMLMRGLVRSREMARALILEGMVEVNGEVIDKAGAIVRDDVEILIKEAIPFVSRGGLKLRHAIEEFKIDVNDKVAMDVGASTGGFTDCLLQYGARRVYAIDVGYGQLDYKLRNDPRVVVLEKTNIRYIDKNAIPELVDIATVDVSFISLTKVIPKICEFLKQGGEMIALIKPQFEAGRKYIEKGGIVRDEGVRKIVVDKIQTFAGKMGFRVIGTIPSPIKGLKGNIEFLMYATLHLRGVSYTS